MSPGVGRVDFLGRGAGRGGGGGVTGVNQQKHLPRCRTSLRYTHLFFNELNKHSLKLNDHRQEVLILPKEMPETAIQSSQV